MNGATPMPEPLCEDELRLNGTVVECKRPACATMRWPGDREKHVCREHLRERVALGLSQGFTLPVHPYATKGGG